jgi:hypothetical protein
MVAATKAGCGANEGASLGGNASPALAEQVPPARVLLHADVMEGQMPAKSKSQQKAAGAALAAKRGDQKVSDLKGPAKSMYESMSEKQLEEFASTKRKGKPQHASKK